VGNPVTADDVALTDGTFTMDIGAVHVDGAANPITTGANIVATLVLVGIIVDDETFCGTVNGDVTQPIQTNIDGSAFGAMLYDGDFTELGEEFLARCPAVNGGGDPAPDAGGE
jgi:hypothetical protein